MIHSIKEEEPDNHALRADTQPRPPTPGDKSMKKRLSILCVAAAQSWAFIACAAVPRQEYDALILQARAGDYEPALAMLRRHALEHPQDLRATYDRILISSWAGHGAETIAAYEGLQPAPNRPPADVLEATARAYRDARQWDKARHLFSEGRRLFPDRPGFAVGEIMVLTDAGRQAEALALASDATAKWPEDADLQLALAYAHRSRRANGEVLLRTSRAQTLAPGKPYVNREYILALQQSGLSEPALRLAEQHPGLLSDAELRHLQADHAAELTRIAAMPARNESERFDVADRVLGIYDRLIPQWEALGEEARQDTLRLRFDRLHALHARARMSDIVQEYERLRAQGVAVPRYALNVVAAAYLHLRRPEQARDLYHRLVFDEPDDGEEPGVRLANQTGLFYALQESQQYEEADKILEQLRASQPQWRRVKGQPEPLPNEYNLYAQHTVALGKLYANDTVAAERALAHMVEQAPNNSSLRSSLASAYRAREWPRRSEVELKMAETLTPRNLDVEIGQVETAMALQEWRQAELLLQDISARYPENLRVRRLMQDWETHNKAELRVSGYRDLDSGGPATGNGGFGMETVLYSAPLRHDWRVFGGAGYAAGEYDEGEARYRWLRTGVEWRGRDLTAEAEVSAHSYGQGVKPGFRVSASLDLNDQWQIGAMGELRSRQTPLRALLNDVSSNSAGVWLRWRANERREWRLALTPSRFSDGNRRISALLSGRERLYTAPRARLDLELEAYASHNSNEEAMYFNPRSDFMLLPTLSLTHTLYRHYETALEQKFTLGAGVYAQKGYGPGAVGALGYGIRYRRGNTFDVGVSISGVSRPYDGQRERELRVMLDMNLRF
ncbi:MAG: poly-beta-1,6 N-acetyl-D-glucosamine export porin PgaA [Alcaligenaceae bacterium]|nr:poly-beta-1,6 N-acetyl-D-glucosamine export porin PgaA [Alcaligenaceae bacterium]